MLRPFLIVGVGGSGGKTLRGLRYQLELKLQQIGWRSGIPDAWQMLHIDTPTVQDGIDFPLPFLPPENYKGLVTGDNSYANVAGSIIHGNRVPASVAKDVERLLPDKRFVKVDVTIGAGQYRAVGRAVVLSSPGDVATAAKLALDRMSDAKAVGELRNLGDLIGAKEATGEAPTPTIIIVSSIAGGSGAGQFLDIAEIIKSTSSVKSMPLANQFFSLLYAPDVFDQLDATAGMSGNALAAIAETTNGFWTDSPSEATIELLKSNGIQPPYGEAMNQVGAAYPFVIGRSNSKVTFANQGEVYSAVATSLTAWITDDKVQGAITTYASGNWQTNVGANVLPDASRLMARGGGASKYQSPPFASIGFGRVTLGRDKFQQYASERLARSAVDRMLYAHVEDDPTFAVRTQDDWIALKVRDAYESFIKALKLNEESEDNNDVIDVLRAEEQLDALQAELRMQVQQEVSQTSQLDKQGGLDLTTWSDRIITANSQFLPGYLQRDSAARQQLLAEWIKNQPDHVLRTVAEFVALYGLPVVVELLARLTKDVKSASEGLVGESRTRDSYVARLDSSIAEELGVAANQSSIRPESDAVQAALDRVAQAMTWSSEARLRESTAALLEDFRANFLEPLRDHLRGSLVELRERVGARQTIDGRENDYSQWPERSDDTVPRKYEPAPNERLLVPHTSFPQEFAGLISSSMSGAKSDDAMIDVVSEILVGPALDDASVAVGDRWTLIGYPRSWRPTPSNVLQAEQTAQTPRFEFAGDPERYVERARIWMAREGTAFNGYITADLNSFFDKDDPNVTPDVFAKRRDKFRQEFTAALGASEPLVKLNANLMKEVHSKSTTGRPTLVFSSIPFREGTELYDVAKSVLAAQGLWDESRSPGWFQDANVSNIEVFAMSAFPYQSIVMNSVMEPIARAWTAQSNTIDSRTAFWLWKRSRLLAESIPADAVKLNAMVRGWFVAKALGQLKETNDDRNRGPKLEIWDPENRQYVGFPFPLLYPGIAPTHDYPGVVIESLIVALVMCNGEGSLQPLRAYHCLMDLGGESQDLSPEFSDWIQDGVMPERAPLPNPERAGAHDATLAARQDALRTYFDNEESDFELKVLTQDLGTSVYDYPVSWEIRTQILGALDALRSRVLVARPKGTGV